MDNFYCIIGPCLARIFIRTYLAPTITNKKKIIGPVNHAWCDDQGIFILNNRKKVHDSLVCLINVLHKIHIPCYQTPQ